MVAVWTVIGSIVRALGLALGLEALIDALSGPPADQVGFLALIGLPVGALAGGAAAYSAAKLSRNR